MSTYAAGNGYGQRPPPGGGGRGNPGGTGNRMKGRGDAGDTPAALPPLGTSRLEIRADSVASSLTSPSLEERRREERRSKRAAAREVKRSMVDGPGVRTSWGLQPGDPMPDFDDPDDYPAPLVPGSFAVAGPGARETQVGTGAKGKSPAVYEDHDNLIEGGGAGDDEKTTQNLPVAFEAEVVFDYPNHNVVVAQKDEGRRTVPLHWLLIGGCIMFIAAVAISVGLGLALGGDDQPSTSSSSLVAEPTFQPVVPPTFPPVVAPTFPPVVAPTFTPVVPPTFTPVVPPTYPPQDGPTPPPQPPPTFTPVVPPTFTPVVPPTFTPVVAPVTSPTNTQPVVQPTFAPVQQPNPILPPTSPPVEPTNPPTDPPVAAPVEVPVEAPVQPPVEAPVSPPVEAPVQPPEEAPVEPPVQATTDSPTETPVEAPTDSNNPIYTSDGLSCKCRYYTEDILVSSTDDYRTLSSGEVGAYIDAMLGIFDSFTPYPFRRLLATTFRARKLQPSSVNYYFEVDGQSLIGTAGTDPFGVRAKFYYEFCVDDASYIDDYHDAFERYMQDSGNREGVASQIRNAGLSSLTEMEAPKETGEFCG